MNVEPAPQPQVAGAGQPGVAIKVEPRDTPAAKVQAPPTPAATASPTFSSSASTSMPLPSFLSTDPVSSDPDSSSSEDGFGRPKGPKAPRISRSTGLPRPRPSYYYDAEYDPGTAGSKKKGRRGGYKGVPVFEPTLEDFAGNGGFYGYVKRIEKYGMRSGIVKVVPPKDWKNDLSTTLPPLRDVRLREPIEQMFTGSQGLYRVVNVAKSRIWNAAQWREMSVQDKWAAPDLKGDKEKTDRSERSTVSEKVSERRKAKKEAKEAMGKGKGKGRVKEEDEEAEAEADGEYDEEDEDEDAKPKKGRRTPATKAASRRPSNVSLSTAAASPTPSTSGSPPLPSASAYGTDDTEMLPPSASASPSTAPSAAAVAPPKKRQTNLERAAPTDSEWKAFEEKYQDLPHGMKKEDYSVEMMRDFERRYWRTLIVGEAPMYGADMAGSLFTPDTTAWNVAALGDLLPLLAPKECSIPGVVSPYLYFGMWRATFAWHVEDADLYSINYIHFGAPKFWYAVPQEQRARFERVMEGNFPTDFRKCHEFLRHKAFLASPRVLAGSGITLNRVCQLPGEFILTYPKGYHSGFNLGFNCAESINFATEKWLPLGKVAKFCKCIEDSVNIDVNIWLKEAAKAEAVAKGEPWPYDSEPEELSSDGPAAAASIPGVSGKKRMAPSSTSTTVAKKPKAQARQQQQQQQQQQYQQQQQQQFVLAPEARLQLLALLDQYSGVLPPQLEYLNIYIPYLHAPPPPPPPIQRPSSIPQPNPYAKSSFVYASNSVSSAAPKLQRAPSSSSHSAKPAATPAPQVAAPTPPPPPPKEYTCCLCPDPSREGLVKVGEAGGKRKRDGEGLTAHRVCVMFTPATWIEIDDQTGEEMVRGYAKIEKARWKLKCQLCTEQHGTKIQCTKGKCTKAVHVTCALQVDSGIKMDATVPDPDHPGETTSILDAALDLEALDRAAANGEAVPKEEEKPAAAVEEKSAAKQIADADNDSIVLTVLCRTHNPEYQRLEAERKAKELRSKVDALLPGARIKVKTSGGAFDVTLDAVNVAAESVSFIFDDGKRNSVKWKLIIWPTDPDLIRKQLEKQQRSEQAKAAIMDRPKYTNKAKRLSSTPSLPPPSAPPSFPSQHVPTPPMGGHAFPNVLAPPQQQQQQAQQQQQRPHPQQSYSPAAAHHSPHPSPQPIYASHPPPAQTQQTYHPQRHHSHSAYPPPPQSAYGAAPPPQSASSYSQLAQRPPPGYQYQYQPPPQQQQQQAYPHYPPPPQQQQRQQPYSAAPPALHGYTQQPHPQHVEQPRLHQPFPPMQHVGQHAQHAQQFQQQQGARGYPPFSSYATAGSAYGNPHPQAQPQPRGNGEGGGGAAPAS